MITVYVLISLSSKILYVGITEDIQRRLAEHNAGKSKFTSGHLPWSLVYTEEATDHVEGRKREKYLKSSAGKRFLKKELEKSGSLPD